MAEKTEQWTMSDGNVNVVHVWLPAGEPRGVVVLSHGMAEHAARYARFGDLLSQNGIALYAEDHRGHGQTGLLAQEKGTGRLGFLAPKDGFFRVADDIHEEIEQVRERHPGKKVVLFGHSFGSFVSQCVIEKYGQSLDGCILCGTAGPRLALMRAAKCTGFWVRLFRGAQRPSPFLDKLAFGAYNKGYQNPRTAFDWLSRDNAEVDTYIADELCGFTCTSGFFCDLFDGLLYVHKGAHMRAIPRDLPVHIIVGTADPVGDNAQSVRRLYDAYIANGMTRVDLRLWDDARHELLNETNRDQISADVLSWLNAQVFPQY